MRHKNEQNSKANYGNYASYLINGYTFNFIRVHKEAGLHRGYCPKRHQYAWLWDDAVQFDGEAIILAKKL